MWGPPRVAAIIPAYKQPGLLGEAIVSVLRQEDSARAAAVVVDDGCPMPETRDVALTFSRANPGRVHLLRRSNGGLSAARNTGVDFALAAWPDLEAVMFLDADNRIEKHYLARALAALSAAPADVGWVYPDVDMIGLTENWSTRGEFSVLALLDKNYCDAGSVARRSLLLRGLRFDESLRNGFEDWDFWLQAAEAGFRGQHLPGAGFRYRRRGESMVAAAYRRREIVVSAMNQKRREFLLPRRLQALEAKEAPRFAIVDPDEGLVGFTHDPGVEGRSFSMARAVARLRAFQASPAAVSMPPLICFASRAARSLLTDALLLPWVFWLVQVLARDRLVVRVFLTFGAGAEARVEIRSPALAVRPAGKAAIIALRTLALPPAAAAKPRTTAWAIADDPEDVATVEIELPDFPGGANEVSRAGAERALADFIAEMSRPATPPPRHWRLDGRPPRADLIGLYERVCDVGVLLPLTRSKEGRGEIGFLIPIHAFGGVEKVVANQARVLRGRGYRPHLFISSARSFLLTSETREAFASVNLLCIPGFDGRVDGFDYFGAAMSGFEQEGDSETKRDALGLLCGMDVIINTHSLGGHGIAGRLREFGVRMMVALHLVERDEDDAPIGNPHMALAYEHSYERVLVISRKLRDWCLAHGVPEEKILLLPNAPSYRQGGDPRTLRARRQTRPPGPLRILFLGRLDPQKGIDRLAALIRATKCHPFAWRVIGKGVLSDSAAQDLAREVAVEPPVHGAAELDALYDWADVLVVPSRFEGAPLTILEARRRGVTVVAMRVGAVDEVTANAGFLIDPRQDERSVLASFVEVLERLSGDAELLRAQALLALDSPSISWEQSLEPLLWAIEHP